MDTKTPWKTIRALHSSSTGVPPHIVDYIAVERILFGFVTGLGTETLVELYDLSDVYVEDVIKEYLFCASWEEDLKFNPIKVYRDTFTDRPSFYTKITEYNKDFGYAIPPFNLYNACELYVKIKEQIDLWDLK